MSEAYQFIGLIGSILPTQLFDYLTLDEVYLVVSDTRVVLDLGFGFFRVHNRRGCIIRIHIVEVLLNLALNYLGFRLISSRDRK